MGKIFITKILKMFIQHIFIKAGGKRAVFGILSGIFSLLHVYSQNADFNWAVNAGGSLSDYSRSITADKNNNVYITGEFQQQAIFDTTTLYSAYYDLFMAKYSESNGSLIWVKQATASQDVFSVCVAADNSNNVYITGLFIDTLSIGDTIIPGTAGLKNAFLAKYNDNGQFLWARSAYSDQEATSYYIAVNSLNEVYWVTWFEHTISFPNYTTVDTTLTDVPFYPIRHSVAIARVNGSGDLLYVRRISGDDCVHAGYIHVDNADNYYISGVFYENADFGDTVLQTPDGGSYLAKFNNNNQLLWTKQESYAGFSAICTDNENNVYIGGVIVPGYLFENIQLPSNGGTDIFIAKYDSSGNFKWVKQAGGIGNDNCNIICCNGNNEIYIGGSFNDTAYFNNDSVISKGGSDMYIAKFDSSGNFSFVKNFGTIYNDNGISIACISSGNLLLTGTFKNKLFWENDSLTGYGAEDAFLAKLSIPDFTDMQNKDLLPSVRYYPNPCEKFISVEFSKIEEDMEMELINIFGQPVYSQKLEKTGNKTTVQLDISSLFKGIYIIKVTGSNYFYSGKLLKI